MRSTVFAIAACAALATTAAYADPPDFAHYTDHNASAKAAPGTSPYDEITCKPNIHEGEVIGKPICATRRAWEQQRRKTADSVTMLQLKSDLVN